MPRMGWPRRIFVKMFDAGKTRMIGLPYSEKKAVFIWYQNVTDGQTDRFAISISLVSMLTRDNYWHTVYTLSVIGVGVTGCMSLAPCPTISLIPTMLKLNMLATESSILMHSGSSSSQWHLLINPHCCCCCRATHVHARVCIDNCNRLWCSQTNILTNK